MNMTGDQRSTLLQASWKWNWNPDWLPFTNESVQQYSPGSTGCIQTKDQTELILPLFPAFIRGLNVLISTGWSSSCIQTGNRSLIPESRNRFSPIIRTPRSSGVRRTLPNAWRTLFNAGSVYAINLPSPYWRVWCHDHLTDLVPRSKR